MTKPPAKAEKSEKAERQPVSAMRVEGDWRHDVAAALHGWVVHAHHAGEPMALTAVDYESALAAVEKPYPLKPHKAAVSEYRGKAK